MNGPKWILAGYTEEQLACGENLKDIARFFDYAETLNVVSELPEIPTDEEEIDEDGFSGYTYGDLFLPSPDVEEFQERFVRPELAKVFWCFATDALKGETCEHLACDLQADLDTASPYASAHVFLEESIEDMGDLYPVGEYTFMGVYDSSKQYEPYSVVWKNDRLSVAVDNREGGIDWEEVGDVYDADNDEWLDRDVQTVMDSTIRSLMRVRKAYDLHGEALPFYIDVNTENSSPELPYVVGSTANVVENDYGFYFDRFDGFEFLVFEEDEDGNEVASAVTESEGEYVRFHYTLGNQFETETSEVHDGLSCYVTYPYERKTGKFSVFTEAGENYTYDDVDYDNPKEGGAVAEYKAGTVLPDFMDAVNLIRYEGTLGMHDVNRSGDRIHIERGRSALFEPLNILGEVNSVEDIENYRDDYFRIRGKND